MYKYALTSRLRKVAPGLAGAVLFFCSLAAGLASVPASASTTSTTNLDLGSCLYAGQFMQPGQYLDAPPVKVGSNKYFPYRLVMQTDGNLVEYAASGQALWDTETYGHAGAHLALQSSDGNLVIYPPSGKYLWTASLPHSPGDRLCVQDDGNVVVYTSANSPLWATMTLSGTGITASKGETLSYNPTYENGQCTDWAERSFHAWTGTYINTLGINGTSGNALDWAYNAAHRGWTVGSVPRIGSIAVFQPGVDGADGYGHVAWVTQVYPSQNAIEVSEWNFTYGPYKTDTRRVSPAFRVGGLQYIYSNP
jgi:surface antigen